MNIFKISTAENAVKKWQKSGNQKWQVKSRFLGIFEKVENLPLLGAFATLLATFI